MTTSIELRYTTSRGRDTYGYNICNLYVNGQKKASCNGGGYDMSGTNLGNWIAVEYADRLRALPKRVFNGHRRNGETVSELYGLTYHDPNYDFDAPGAVWSKSTSRWPTKKHTLPRIDGGCGMSSVQYIMEKIGLKLQYVPTRGKNSTIYTLIDSKV